MGYFSAGIMEKLVFYSLCEAVSLKAEIHILIWTIPQEINDALEQNK